MKLWAKRAAMNLVALLAAGAGSCANASPLFSMMQTYCVSGHAQADAAIKAAEADGFIQPDNPAELIKDIGVVEDGQVRIKEADGARYALIVGHPTARGFLGDAPIDSCVLITTSVDQPSLLGELQAWTGLTPNRAGDTDKAFLFIDGPQGRQDVTRLGEAEARAKARQGLVTVVLLSRQSNLVALEYSVTRVDAAPTTTEAGGKSFDDFAALCLAHRDAPADALKAADAAGWMPAPPSTLAHDIYPMKDGEVRLKSSASDFEYLIAGHMRFQLGLQRLSGPFCAIAQAPPNDDLLRAAVDWTAGAQPVDATAGSSIYLFAEVGGKRVPLSERDLPGGLSRRFRAGPVLVLITELGAATADHAVVGVGLLTTLQAVSNAPPDRLASR